MKDGGRWSDQLPKEREEEGGLRRTENERIVPHRLEVAWGGSSGNYVYVDELAGFNEEEVLGQSLTKISPSTTHVGLQYCVTVYPIFGVLDNLLGRHETHEDEMLTECGGGRDGRCKLADCHQDDSTRRDVSGLLSSPAAGGIRGF